uniref:Uncharacterized protein n=2 Tax=Micrurus TaxID=8634 RepID=A0A2D4L594_9SAUR
MLLTGNVNILGEGTADEITRGTFVEKWMALNHPNYLNRFVKCIFYCFFCILNHSHSSWVKQHLSLPPKKKKNLRSFIAWDLSECPFLLQFFSSESQPHLFLYCTGSPRLNNHFFSDPCKLQPH